MAVSYTITPEAYAEDGERSDTLHQCPLCGIEYDISEHAEWSPNGLDYNESGDWIGLRWGHHVTANCDCRDKHAHCSDNRRSTDGCPQRAPFTEHCKHCPRKEN